MKILKEGDKEKADASYKGKCSNCGAVIALSYSDECLIHRELSSIFLVAGCPTCSNPIYCFVGDSNKVKNEH